MDYSSKISRRLFLKGLGASVGMLTASSLLPTNLMAAQTGRPQRFLIYFQKHGWPIELVDTFGSGSNWLSGNQILGSLAPWQDKVTVLRGCSQTATNDAHQAGRSVLRGNTGVKDSVDVSIAKALDDRPWVLSSAARSNQFFNCTNFEGGHGIADFVQPLEFVEQAFANTSDPAATVRAQRYRSQLLTMNERQLEKLSDELKDLTREESRLSSHLDSVREIKARSDAGRLAVNSTTVEVLKSRLEHTRHLDGNNTKLTQPIFDGHLDALAVSLVSGATKVATLRSHGHIGNFPGGPNVDGDIHMNSHNGNAQHRTQHYGKHLRWYIDRLATLVEKLDVQDPLDPAHTVLDNTTILFTSEMCDGSHVADAKEITIAGGKHYTYYPFVLIGGGGGQINSGGVIQANATHYDVLQTLANIHGTQHGSGKVIRDVLA